jgi:ABC-type branched-subunit amino acid transport system ATPase component
MQAAPLTLSCAISRGSANGLMAGPAYGGGQQMLAIACGLLLPDEPTLGLARAMTKLYAILADLRDDGATVRVDQMATLALAEPAQ